MTEFLYQLSDIYLFILLTLFFIILSIVMVILVKRKIPHELRYRDNAVVGNISALISIIYGVLAGLTALYLINNINATNDAVNREASAVANIYRDSAFLPEPTKTQIRSEIQNYLNHVINVEWKLMRDGKKINEFGDQAINNIAQTLRAYTEVNIGRILLIHDLMEEIKALYNARQERIHVSYDSLNPAIWVVLLIGTLLTLTINYLFGMNLFLHLITVSAVALMLASMVYLIVTLDRPFRGEFAIRPEALQSVLHYTEKNP